MRQSEGNSRDNTEAINHLLPLTLLQTDAGKNDLQQLHATPNDANFLPGRRAGEGDVRGPEHLDTPLRASRKSREEPRMGWE